MILFTFLLLSQINKVIVTVNGEPIFQSDLEKNVKSISMQLSQEVDYKKLREEVLNQMINEKLIIQEARNSKIKVPARILENEIKQVKESFRFSEDKILSDEELEKAFNEQLKKENLTYEEFRKRLEERIQAEMFIENMIRERVKLVDEKTAEAYYNAAREYSKTGFAGTFDPEIVAALSNWIDMREAERVRVSHILLRFPTGYVDPKTKAFIYRKMEKIRGEILKGKDFHQAALEYSEDMGSKANGGDLGYIVKGMMIPEFEEVAFKTPVGELSNIFETKFGYHILMVTEKKAKRRISFREVKDEVKDFIYSLRREEELRKFLEELKAKADIKYR
ncbi:MAG: peptidylprolyl isomerase [bacterium]|nr:peptidylprolyl isomerase [bacterium]